MQFNSNENMMQIPRSGEETNKQTKLIVHQIVMKIKHFSSSTVKNW